jgi:hypothetical protein
MFVCEKSMSVSETANKASILRSILIFIPGPQGGTSPLGVNFVPYVGAMFPLRSPSGVNTRYCLVEWRGEQRITSPPGDNSDKFLPLGAKLRIGLWGQFLANMMEFLLKKLMLPSFLSQRL